MQMALSWFFFFFLVDDYDLMITYTTTSLDIIKKIKIKIQKFLSILRQMSKHILYHYTDLIY